MSVSLEVSVGYIKQVLQLFVTKIFYLKFFQFQ